MVNDNQDASLCISSTMHGGLVSSDFRAHNISTITNTGAHSLTHSGLTQILTATYGVWFIKSFEQGVANAHAKYN